MGQCLSNNKNMKFSIYLASLLSTFTIIYAHSRRTASNKYVSDSFNHIESFMGRSSDNDKWIGISRDFAKYFHGDKRTVQPGRKVRYEELKFNLSHLDSFNSYENLIETSINLFQNKVSNDNIYLVKSMEDLLFDKENSIIFIYSDGIEGVILPGLNSTDDIKLAVLELFQLVVFNNTDAKELVLDTGVMEALLAEIDLPMESAVVGWDDGQAIIAAEVLAALQSLIEDFTDAEDKIFALNGLEIMKNLFSVILSNEDDLAVPFKIVLMTKKLIKRQAMFNENTNLVEKLIEDAWCENIYSFLVELSDDIVNKINNGRYLPMWANISNEIYTLMVTTTLDLVYLLGNGCQAETVNYEDFFRDLLAYFESVYRSDSTAFLTKLHTHCIYFLDKILENN